MPANNTNIPQYSAADLLRYATGNMTAPEMYALEKAALEDPFLAEALEGYMEAAASQPQPILQEQIGRLQPATKEKEETNIIPLWRSKALRVAIAALFIAGAGWLIFSLVQPKQNQPQNKVATREKQNLQTADTNVAGNMVALDSTIAMQPKLSDTQFASLSINTVPHERSFKKTQISETKTEAVAASPTLSESDAAPVNTYSYKQKATEKDQVADIMLDSITASKTFTPNTTNTKEAATEDFLKKSRVAAMRYNYYGKITDSQGNSLPYTNVTIVGQEFGTYTDASGNFNFISEDSSLPVRARSLGYLPQNLTLRSGKQKTNIVLQEDEKLKNNLTVFVPKRQEPAAKSQRTIVERDSIEGAEPSIGITDYNLYLANNNRLSELQQMGRQVQLNFEVDKNGNATNITVSKSSGEALDNEAIRLLKEGPKWKGKNGKKGKITVQF